MRIIFVVFIMACLTALGGCASSGKRISTEPTGDTDVPGVFTLILYGGNYLNDLETAAFLDKAGDAYTFDIYAPEFNYRMIKGLSFEEGIRKAKEHISRNGSYQQAKVSRILNDKAETIGYEVRPLCLPLTYGVDDVLDIGYAAKENKVVVTVRLKPFLKGVKPREEREDRDDFKAR